YPPQPGPPPTPRTLGASFDLADWPARGLRPLDPPLTALGPGNPTFAANVPVVQNVLNFPDPLTDVPVGLLSYAVYGWYADPTLDPLFADGPSGWRTEADR